MSEMHIANMDEAQRLIREANAREDALREETARLRCDVEHRLGEMNLQARWTREAQEKVELLRSALKPFAEVAKVYVKRANNLGPQRVPEASTVLGANDAQVTVAQCRAALKALGDSGLTE